MDCDYFNCWYGWHFHCIGKCFIKYGVYFLHEKCFLILAIGVDDNMFIIKNSM